MASVEAHAFQVCIPCRGPRQLTFFCVLCFLCSRSRYVWHDKTIEKYLSYNVSNPPTPPSPSSHTLISSPPPPFSLSCSISVDQVAGYIQNMSGSEKELLQLEQRLNQINLPKLGNGLAQILQALPAKEYTLGWIYILDAMTAQKKVDYDTFLDATNSFFQEADSKQLLLGRKALNNVVRKYTEYSCALGMASLALSPLLMFSDRLLRKEGELTVCHSCFVQACISASNFSFAKRMLDNDVLCVDTETSEIEAVDVLGYFYYGGYVYTVCGQLEKASSFFLAAITAPAFAVSKIAILSYKKYILVNLIMSGSVPELPKYTSTMIARLAEPICSPYVELATAYGMGLQDLEKCVETNMEIFQEDQNFGLIKQVLKSLKKKQIQDLTNTYMTLSLANIAENAGLSSEQEAEQEILDMIANGEIFAKIDQDKGMVAFEEDPETYDSRPVIDQLAAEIIE
eukprot:TRINITY_DN407_c0_g2_i1.p1 TRINITY_DN407_c0_g2~~TRINITY_DN407_c0_g2_i1.p1  ORF type:complete len:456 (+),score=108.37 TRINITY_DN407_c0_g2_i1:287-1654(+)